MNLLKSKKGFQLRDLPAIAIIFGTAIIVLSIIGTIVSDVRDTQTASEHDYNVSTEGLEGLTTLGDWLPTIAVIIAAAVVIGVIVRYFQA